MSSLPRGAAFLVAAAIGVAPGPVRAQQGDLEQRVLAHLDTLLPLISVARAEVGRAQAARDSVLLVREASTLDTFLVGPIRVITFHDQRGQAEDIMAGAWDGLASLVTHSPGLEHATFFFSWSRQRRPPTVDRQVEDIVAPRWVRRRSVEAHARAGLGRVLARDLGGDLVAWSGTWAVGAPARAEQAYRALATTPSQANRRCIMGEAEACALALALDVPDDPLPLWYSGEEAAALAVGLHERWAAQSWYRREPRNMEAANRCRREAANNRHEACYAFLHEHRSRVPAPLGMNVRQSVVWVALQAGGAGSWDRLTADPSATPAAALEAASGLSLTELAGAWRDWVEDQRPQVYGGLGVTRWSAFFWFLFFALLALRSTRWRLA